MPGELQENGYSGNIEPSWSNSSKLNGDLSIDKNVPNGTVTNELKCNGHDVNPLKNGITCTDKDKDCKHKDCKHKDCKHKDCKHKDCKDKDCKDKDCKDKDCKDKDCKDKDCKEIAKIKIAKIKKRIKVTEEEVSVTNCQLSL